jgi:hypothetical protein
MNAPVLTAELASASISPEAHAADSAAPDATTDTAPEIEPSTRTPPPEDPHE